MKNRPKFFKYCGNAVELRVEQRGSNAWRGYVYHGWRLAIPEIDVEGICSEDQRQPCHTVTEGTKKACQEKAEAMVEKFPPDERADKEWRDQSDMPDEDWAQILLNRGFHR
jgi:hypothetical protein